MQRAHIDISRDLEGEPVVHACFDVTEREVAAATHAVKAVAEERFRMSDMSADDVLELREMTALADELASGLPVGEADGAAPPEDGAPRPADLARGDDLDGGLLADDTDGPMRTIVMRPARLTVFREAVAQ